MGSVVAEGDRVVLCRAAERGRSASSREILKVSAAVAATGGDGGQFSHTQHGKEWGQASDEQHLLKLDCPREQIRNK